MEFGRIWMNKSNVGLQTSSNHKDWYLNMTMKRLITFLKMYASF